MGEKQFEDEKCAVVSRESKGSKGCKENVVLIISDHVLILFAKMIVKMI